MKLLIVVLSVLGVSLAGAENLNLGDVLKQLAENVKLQMPCGFSNYNIPPLAPYTNSSVLLNGDVGGSEASYQVQLTNLYIDGLNDYTVIASTYDESTKSGQIDVNFNGVKVFSEYSGSGSITLGPWTQNIFGAGLINFKLEDLRISSQYWLQPTGSNGLTMNYFSSQFSVGNVVSSTTGLNSDSYMSEYFNRRIEEFVKMQLNDNVNANTLSSLVQTKVMKRVNPFLANLNYEGLTNILKLLSGNSDSGVFGAPVCNID